MKTDNKKHLIGILGGMGPSSSVQFYADLISYCQNELNIFYNKDYPHILISNLPVPDLIKGTRDSKISRQMVIDEIGLMEKSGVEAIALACNTMHLYINEFKEAAHVPILNILEEVANELERKNKHKVGILATPTTLNYDLYQNALKNRKIDFIIPNQTETTDLGEIIMLTLGGKADNRVKTRLKEIIENMVKQGIDSILFGCTELGILVKQSDVDIEIINSITVLAKSVANISLGKRPL